MKAIKVFTLIAISFMILTSLGFMPGVSEKKSKVNTVKTELNYEKHRLSRDEIEEIKSDIHRDRLSRVQNSSTPGFTLPTDEDYEEMIGSTMVDGVDGGNLPESIDLTNTKYFPPVGDQGTQGSCGAWAAGYYANTYAQAKAYNFRASSGYDENLMSPAWIYNHVRGEEKGSNYEDIYSHLAKVGNSNLACMPYDDSTSESWGDETAWRNASKFRISRYEKTKVWETEVIKSWLDSGSLVCFANDADQYANTWTNLWSDDSDCLTTAEYTPGDPNHGQTIVGYNDSKEEDGEVGAFKVVNSWGPNWGPEDDGTYWMTYELFSKLEFLLCYRIAGTRYNESSSPSTVATWRFGSTGSRDAELRVGVGKEPSLEYKEFGLEGRSSNEFPSFMCVDVTEWSQYFKKENYSLRIGTGDVQSTIDSFRVERYEEGYPASEPERITPQSPDVPFQNPGIAYTSVPNYAPLEPSEPVPKNGSDRVGTDPELRVNVSDPNEEEMEVKFNLVSDNNTQQRSTTVFSNRIVSMQFFSLDEGTRYVWNVSASDGEITTNSPSWVFFTLEAPAAPHGLIGNCGDGYVNLRWSQTDQTSEMITEEYNIYRRANDKTWSLLDEVNHTSLSYNDTTVENGVTYHYHVTAENGAGESNKTRTTTFRPIGPPTPPVDFTVEAGPDSARLDWNVPENKGGFEHIHYVIYRGNSSRKLSPLTEVENTSYSDTSVDTDETYYYRLKAVNPEGESGPTETRKVHTPTSLEYLMPANPLYLFLWVTITLSPIVVLFLISESSGNRTKVQSKDAPKWNQEFKKNVRQEIILCPRCGSEVIEDKPVCSSCGASLGRTESSQTRGKTASRSAFNRESKDPVCPNCGLALNVDDSSCPRCGTLIKQDRRKRNTFKNDRVK